MPSHRDNLPLSVDRHGEIERWVEGKLGEIQHERRVGEIVSRLYHLTRPLHDLTPGDLRLLRLAAVVHDVGRSIHDKTHPADGARLLLTEPRLPLSPAERRRLAYLTLYHRGKVPDAGRDGVLTGEDDPQRMLDLLCLLRAGDALDSRRLQSPMLLFALAPSRLPGDPRLLRITCYLQSPCPRTRRVYARRKKFRLLEDRLRCRVEIQLAEADALEMVA